jgi:hypothetical protein
MSAEITWRRYTPADEAAVLALKQEEDKVLGKTMDFNDLTQHPVLIAEVGELDGKIIGAHTLEAVPEYCMFTRDPRFTAAAAKRAPQLCAVLQEHGFRLIRCIVPDWMKEDTGTIQEALQRVGFGLDPGYLPLILDLRPPKKAAN